MSDTSPTYDGRPLFDPNADKDDPVIWFNVGTKTWVASNAYNISSSLKYNDWIYIATKQWWIVRDVALVTRYEKYIREQDKDRYKAEVARQAHNFDVSYWEDNPEMPWAVSPNGDVEKFIPVSRLGDLAFPYQTVVWTEILHRNLLIADEMGLGKTVEAIQALNVLYWFKYRARKKLMKVLVMSPNTMVLKWHMEILKWMTVPFEDLYYEVQPWSQITKLVKNNPDEQWDLIIVDEAHYAKNSGSQRSQAFSKLKGTHRICLTGTPILARPSEVYPIADWIEPMILGTPSQFDAKYEVKYLQRNRSGQSYWRYSIDTRKVEALQRKMRETIMVARFKADVLKQLPPKQRSVVEIDFGQEVSAIEERMLALWDELQAKGGHDLALKSNIFALRHESAILKIPMVNAFVEETWEDSQRPIVVFCHHKLVLEEIVKHMRMVVDDPTRVESLSGKYSRDRRSQIVEEFQNGQYDILVAGMTVSGLGITLTHADICIFAELDWTPANITQAEDRLHRIGQLNPLNIYYTVAAGASIDGKLAKVLGDKQEVIDAFNTRLKPLQS